MSIVLDSVVKEYADHMALNSIDLNIKSSSLTALLGPSGSGKSTLLRVIAGLDKPDSGTVYINGRDVTHDSVQDRGLGFVFQHYAVFKHMSIWDNIAFGLKVRKVPHAVIDAKVNELLSLVKLKGLERRKPSQLSGGQRQRLALARALAVEPNVLLLDEPFGALDTKIRDELRSWLRYLHEESELTTVLVTHDQAEALDVADNIVVLNNGAIEQVGSPQTVYDEPVNEFVMQFLGNVSRINGRLVRPHDVRVGRSPALAVTKKNERKHVIVQEAIVERITFLGFEVRLELRNDDNEIFLAQITRGDAEALDLVKGERVYVRATRWPTLNG